ncbi:hypothetical protein HOF78_03170 [Candidatus Woesearchaeota archaeon]|nr:hypothetical protein [Candidatus Woesearchaeota archaeon]
MEKTILVLMLLLLAMPFVTADTNLFDGDVGVGQSVTFYGSDNTQNTVLIENIDAPNERCLVNIGGVSTWVSESDEAEISGFEVEIEDVDSNLCEVKISPKENQRANVAITSLEIVNVEPNSEGFYFVKDGMEVKFLAELTSDSHVNDLEWEFFNNGYPDGEGATKDINGKIDIGIGVNRLEFSMVFRESMDEIYNSGSFITVLVIDPEGDKTTTSAGMNYRGISVYTEGDSGCYRYRDPAGHLIDAGICEITKKERDHAITKVVCLAKEEKFDVGNKVYDVVLTNGLGVLRVNGKAIAGNPYFAEDFFLEAEEYSSDPYCFEIVLGCRGSDCDGSDDEPEVEEEYDDDWFSNSYYILEEGESRTHVVEGIKHTVNLLIVEDVSPAIATFEIDGEVTWQMIEGDIFTNKVDGFKLRLHEITLNRAFDDEDVDKNNGRIDIVSYQIFDEDYDGEGGKRDEEILYPQEEIIGTNCNNGCYVNHNLNKCLPFGTRLEYEGRQSYCNLDGNLLSQKEDGSEASNNYECRSNSARYGVCENIKEQQSAMKAIFGWLSRLFGGN